MAWTEDDCTIHRIEGDNVKLHYIQYDPDGPDQCPNTTVIACHGAGNNSDIWRVLPASFTKPICFVAYNQRSYKGSSPAFLGSSPEDAHQKATGEYLLDLLYFVRFVLQKEDVSSHDIVLVAWSKGSHLLLSLLVVLNSISFLEPTSCLPYHLSTKSITPFLPLLQSHLKGLILFEPPGSSLGRSVPQTVFLPRPGSSGSNPAIQMREWILHGENRSHITPEDSEDMKVILKAQEDHTIPGAFSWHLGKDNEEIASRVQAALQASPFPILLMYGSETEDYFLDAARRISQIPIKHFDVKAIEGAYHFAMVTHPQVFASLIEEFVAKNTSEEAE